MRGISNVMKSHNDVIKNVILLGRWSVSRLESSGCAPSLRDLATLNYAIDIF